MPHGHARGNGVRVHDDVWRDAFGGERHVLAPVRHADGALLPVPGRELVADLREALVANAHLDELVALCTSSKPSIHQAKRFGKGKV